MAASDTQSSSSSTGASSSASTHLQSHPSSHSSSAHPPPPSIKKIHYPFWFGGSSSCFAAMVTHPLDLGE
ncbi:hypothetical protein AAP_05888 [Ascosphaera apis ARSEF 7405]|uniref:Uncharacterized protein n=1 Tax=Ascosphaera apis ARSEF 7405 TaxID=392613 RepID=A0A162I0Q3_9EURO|nr:hypothetical protein AAP_05888 [Ascosphaera apis ARSEF 7405]